MRLLIVVLMMSAGGTSLEAACTQKESEDKVMEVIYALKHILPRNQEKATAAAKKFGEVLDNAKKPALTAQTSQAAIDKLCKDLDEILVELRR